MADSYQKLGPCVNMGGGNFNLGYNAGTVLTTGSGCTFIGHEAGSTAVNASSSIAIGAQASVSSNCNDCVAIGYGAIVSVNSTTAAKSIAIGAGAICDSDNTLVIGKAPGDGTNGTRIFEYGRGHQYYYKLTQASTDLDLSGSTGALALLGGWIAFDGITAAATLTLPSLADMLAVLPTIVNGSCGELILSNFNGTSQVVQVTVGANTYWRNTDDMAANTIQHIIYRYVGGGSPYIEFFS